MFSQGGGPRPGNAGEKKNRGKKKIRGPKKKRKNQRKSASICAIAVHKKEVKKCFCWKMILSQAFASHIYGVLGNLVD
jgi:hypothetical protein